jgi:hypothetical protein
MLGAVLMDSAWTEKNLAIMYETAKDADADRVS